MLQVVNTYLSLVLTFFLNLVDIVFMQTLALKFQIEMQQIQCTVFRISSSDDAFGTAQNLDCRITFLTHFMFSTSYSRTLFESHVDFFRTKETLRNPYIILKYDINL